MYAEVRRKKGHYRWCTVLYAVLLVLYIVATIFANSAARDSLSDEWILELAGISDPSLLHLQLLPFLGLALLAANWMLEKRIPKKEVDVSIPSRAEIYAGVKNVKDKLVWNCDCGATNPTSAKYCPKCGAARPLSIKETELETLDEREIIPPATPGIPAATPSGGSRVKKRFKPMDEFDGDFAQQPTSPGDEGSRLKTRKSSQWDWEE